MTAAMLKMVSALASVLSEQIKLQLVGRIGSHSKKGQLQKFAMDNGRLFCVISIILHHPRYTCPNRAQTLSRRGSVWNVSQIRKLIYRHTGCSIALGRLPLMYEHKCSENLKETIGFPSQSKNEYCFRNTDVVSGLCECRLYIVVASPEFSIEKSIKI